MNDFEDLDQETTEVTTETEQVDIAENAEPSTEVVTEKATEETKAEKTFTQAELDEIIQKRLDREKKKVESDPRLAFVENQAKRYNMTTEQYLEAVRQAEEQEQIQQYAEKTGKTEEEAAREIKTANRLETLERELNMTKRLTTIEKEKAPLKDKIYFKDLEPEIDRLVTDNAEKGVNISVEAAYYYLRGQKLEELMTQTKASTVKSTVANIQDRTNRGLISGSVSQEADMAADVDTEMASAFGNDPREIAKYKKTKLKEMN